MKTFIKIKTQFEFIHCWKEAPKEVEFLRAPHRHDFLVTCQIEVLHNNRELEFFIVLHNLENYINSVLVKSDVTTSCEQFAVMIFEFLSKTYGNNRKIIVEVSEDGKSSAVVEE